jgi:hypothetical protein
MLPAEEFAEAEISALVEVTFAEYPMAYISSLSVGADTKDRQRDRHLHERAHLPIPAAVLRQCHVA